VQVTALSVPRLTRGARSALESTRVKLIGKEIRMHFKKIKSNSIGLLAGSILLLAVGAYSDNGGFQFAGGIMLVVALILAFNQASNEPGDD